MPPLNPYVDCGETACFGGEDCSQCVGDSMPPAFLLSGTFVNRDCPDCNKVDGQVLIQASSSPCMYECDWSMCGSTPFAQLSFDKKQDDSVDVYLYLSMPGSEPELTYLLNIPKGTSCNQAHVLPFDSTAGGTHCYHADSVTLTPCDANGNVAPACNATIPTECCPAVPKSMTATISASSSECCLDGSEIELEFDQDTEQWRGNVDVGCNHALYVMVSCASSSWTLGLRCQATQPAFTGGEDARYVEALTDSCSPLLLSAETTTSNGDGLDETNTSCSCAKGVDLTITITE